VYGNAAHYPTTEADLTQPHSPYGVTKLAAEHLCSLYAANWGLPVVSLRYFTVFGPRQRPDMAMARLVEAAVNGTPFPLFGDGAQVRDFTYVADVVKANLAAARADVPDGTYLNIAGGSSITVGDLIALAEELSGCSIELDRRPAQPGDAQRTGGAVGRAEKVLGWAPQVPVREGLAGQISWYRQFRAAEMAH
jgi:nucleoside-diphosphate-sugar epimerase